MSPICIGSETLLNGASGTCNGERNLYRPVRLSSLKIIFFIAKYDTTKYKHYVQWFYSVSSLPFCAASLFATKFGHICHLDGIIWSMLFKFYFRLFNNFV